MLEAIRERAQGWLAKVILGLIVVSFALFGIDTYFGSGGGEWIASIDGEKISREEFTGLLRDESDRLRGRPGFDSALFDQPEIRRQILDRAINERLLLREAIDRNMNVPDSKIVAAIQGIPAFLNNGTFSRERYVNLLRRQGLTEAGFEARIRQSLLLQDVAGTLGDSAFASSAVAQRLFSFLGERREVRTATFRPEDFTAGIALTPEATLEYYEKNKPSFESPQRVRVEYLQLHRDALMADITLAEAEIEAHYKANMARYSELEQRRASHILIAANPSDAKALAEARAKAGRLLEQVKTHPDDFAKLAKEHSQDPGSATNGGDLDWFQRGLMVKAFEDAVFSMDEGEIRGPIQTDFGFHIIRLTAIQPGRARALDAVRADIEAELREQMAQRRFAEVAERFGDSVYERGESLKPTADELHLKVETSGWMTQDQPAPALAHKELLSAIFARESLDERRNTEAFEVAPQHMVAARVVDYEPARTRAFVEVREQIEAILRHEQAARLAAQAGNAFLNRAPHSEDAKGWGDARVIARDVPDILPAALVKKMFRMNTSKLPAYASGSTEDGNFVAIRLERVARPATMDPATAQQLAATLRNLRGQEETLAHIAQLRASAEIKINQAQLEKKDN